MRLKKKKDLQDSSKEIEETISIGETINISGSLAAGAIFYELLKKGFSVHFYDSKDSIILTFSINTIDKAFPYRSGICLGKEFIYSVDFVESIIKNAISEAKIEKGFLYD